MKNEPVDVHNLMQHITRILVTLPSVVPPPALVKFRLPELLINPKSSLEIEMDRFLARKYLPFKSE